MLRAKDGVERAYWPPVIRCRSASLVIFQIAGGHRSAKVSAMAARDLNLTGDWKGIYIYPRLLPPTEFDAELRDMAGGLTGETFEWSSGSRKPARAMHAMIEGSRAGHAVTFVKRYDDFELASEPVYYTGTLDADGQEISGNWDIPGHWSGTFIMVRSKAVESAVERTISEEVD